MMDATDMESLTTPLQVQAPESPSDDPSDNPINTDISPEESSQNQTRMPGPSVSTQKHKALVGAFVAFTLIVGYTAATQPSGAGWRFFSWHPFLMVSGFIGMMGSSAITKKLGGYTNTKLHGMMASGGLMMAFGGLYVIYKNKEILGKEHITTTHALAGIVTMAGALMASMAGGIFLHPDFGIDKTNQTVRFAHKWFSRSVMASAWITCIFGLIQLTSDPAILALFAIPLIILAPMTLI